MTLVTLSFKLLMDFHWLVNSIAQLPIYVCPFTSFFKSVTLFFLYTSSSCDILISLYQLFTIILGRKLKNMLLVLNNNFFFSIISVFFLQKSFDKRVEKKIAHYDFTKKPSDCIIIWDDNNTMR